MKRCDWCGDDPLYIQYHDEEWGVPSFDNRHLFEMLILEGAQAGLSWITVLRKRNAYREAFAGFDPAKIAAFDEQKVAELLQNPGIIRNRLKVRGAIKNAQAYLNMQAQGMDFAEYVWSFVEGKPIVNHWQTLAEVPAKTALSDRFSKDLKKRGFTFVGSTICYAFMQAVGMVNDHLVTCLQWQKCTSLMLHSC